MRRSGTSGRSRPGRSRRTSRPACRSPPPGRPAMTALGWRLPPNSVTDPEIFAADMALRILAGGTASRGHQVLVRELQAAQGLSTLTDPRTGGNSLGMIPVAAMPGVPAGLIEKALGAELDALDADGPGEEELACARAAAEREALAH